MGLTRRMVSLENVPELATLNEKVLRNVRDTSSDKLFPIVVIGCMKCVAKIIMSSKETVA